MDLILNLLRLLLIVGIALLGILGSGLLAAWRMSERKEPEPSTDPTERNQES
ncbi:hypothetical protein [Streptomyces sp. L7]